MQACSNWVNAESNPCRWDLLKVPVIPPFDVHGLPYQQYHDMYTKLTVFNLTQFKSVIYIDADMVVKGSLRNLFELVMDKIISSSVNSKTIPAPFKFAAANDCWPENFDSLFNAGFFVAEPNGDLFDTWTRNRGSDVDYDGIMAEQNFLNAFFRHNSLNHYIDTRVVCCLINMA